MIEEQTQEIYQGGKIIINHKKIEILPQGNKKSLKIITNNTMELKR
ncbi:hypothetical protein KDE13_09260 [Campylobacter sp. faydin G-140]|nr:hypothetical protein [Campylobacter anatolicus]MBR8466521.1 hypothetical protein [Campylobacter anatolicus]